MCSRSDRECENLFPIYECRCLASNKLCIRKTYKCITTYPLLIIFTFISCQFGLIENITKIILLASPTIIIKKRFCSWILAYILCGSYSCYLCFAWFVFSFSQLDILMTNISTLNTPHRSLYLTLVF